MSSDATTTRIYRYYSFKSFRQKCGVARLLLRNAVYAADPLSFNDPFDPSTQVSFKNASPADIEEFVFNRFSHDHPQQSPQQVRKKAKDIIQERGWDGDALNWKLYNQALQDHFEKEQASKLGIVCFSKVKDDILMWSHYADGHRGVCFEFDSTALNRPNEQFIDVRYREHNERPSVKEYNSDGGKDSFFLQFKSSHWDYEEECRFFYYPETYGGDRLCRLPPESLTGIIIGCRMKAKEQNEILTLARLRTSKYKRPSLRVFRAAPNIDTYSLKVESFPTS